jgi:hypothetical protein
MIPSGLSQHLAQAKESQPYLDAQIHNIAAKIPGTRIATAPIKSLTRSSEKVNSDYKGVVAQLKDAVRNSLVATDKTSYAAAIKAMESRKDIATKSDGTPMIKYQKPEDFNGYEGAIFSIKTPNGHIGETQVVSAKMQYGKGLPEDSKVILGEKLFNQIQKETGLVPGEGHRIYEEIRSLDFNDPKYNEKLDKLKKESVDYYSKLR